MNDCIRGNFAMLKWKVVMDEDRYATKNISNNDIKAMAVFKLVILIQHHWSCQIFSVG